MQPRIYTYKVTFEETPDWYWGAHKEKKRGEFYMGSPKTHVWKWEFYTPSLQICEFFPYTDEGWTKAREVEDRCILLDLNNPLCLNEHVGGCMSLEANRRGAKKLHEEKDCMGRSVQGVKNAERLHKEKDEFGKSVSGVKGAERVHKEKDALGRSVQGVKSAEKLHKEKDALGRSVQGVRSGERLHKEKDDMGRSVNAVKGSEKLHEKKDHLGRSIQGVKNAERMHKVLHEEKNDSGKSAHAVKAGKKGAKNTNTQKWKDPDHPELGEHNPGLLVQMQKARGYPHGKENRVKVG